MPNHTYKKIEIIGSSTQNIEDAVHGAISKASQTLRNMRWFECTEIRGEIKDDKVHYWQVTIKVGIDVE